MHQRMLIKVRLLLYKHQKMKGLDTNKNKNSQKKRLRFNDF